MTDNTNGISLALGTFDGFHLGHMAVIEAAKKSRYPMYALLFDEHPLKAITGKAPAELLSDGVLFRLRDELKIPAIHIDFAEIMNMTPEEFFYEILLYEMDVKELSCGENYSFGKGGNGNVGLLRRLCDKNGVKLNVVPTVMYKGEAISSTRIRKAIENGEIEDANAMLGRPFSYSFPVVSGDKRGHTLGFPTVNQILPDGFVKPRRGVYASCCFVDGKLHNAVTNYGVRPTVDGKKSVSETHIVGCDKELYGGIVEILLLSFIRDEQKFGSLNELSAAIADDIKKAAAVFDASSLTE